MQMMLQGQEDIYLSRAEAAFADTGVKVTSEGRPYLGEALGTEEYMQVFMNDKVKQWVDELEQLAVIASSQPHAAHAAFTHGMSSKWTYFARTMPSISQSLQPLESTITTKLIPALTDRPPPNTQTTLFACQIGWHGFRLGGMGLINPTEITSI